MNPLQKVEDIVGEAVENWPTYVIYNMFLEKPSRTTVKKVAAFMFGNCVPLHKALDCFIACVNKYSYFITVTMQEFYYLWNKYPTQKHKAQYYSINLKRWIWINGTYLNQTETVQPEITVMDFRFEATGRAQFIKTHIEHIRSCNNKNNV